MERFRTILDMVRGKAESHPEALAALTIDGQTITYRHLKREMSRIAATLRAKHIGRADRVVTVLPNGLSAAVGFLGAASCAITVPLNPDLSLINFVFCFKDLDAKGLLVDRELDSAAFAAAEECGVNLIEVPSLAQDASLERDAEVVERDDSPVGDDVALILYTSGTTAAPKRVPLTHGNLMGSAKNVASALELSSEDRCLNVMPLFHIHSLVAGLLSSLVSGGSVVCAPGYDGSQFLDWLEVYEPTWYTAVPTIHQSLLSEMDGRGIADLTSHSLRLIRSSSSALPLHVMMALEERIGVPVIEAYGMTEAAHQIASNPLPPDIRRPGSVGRALGVDVAILNPAKQLQPANTEGEIAIRGETVTSGYESNSEANASAFVDGWFRTGDAGYVDNDGYITLTGRMKEMINRGGEKIAPREVDEALVEHPAVARAIAFSVPHPTLGEDVAAAVVLRDGLDASEAELRGYLLDQLAPFKVPSRFVFVDELPMGATGKPQRIGLADTLEAKLVEPFRSPATPAEISLVKIWQDVLDVDHIGVADNFFMLGGDSLSAARVIARVNPQFGVHLTLRQAFESPKLEDFAVQVELQVLDSIEGCAND